MKRFLIAGLTTLALTTVLAPTAQAKPLSYNPYTANTTAKSLITPSDLVGMAQRGQFKKQGIPSQMQLMSEYNLGRISAKDIVQGGISAQILPSQAASDQSYLNAVDLQLRTIAQLY